MLDVCSLCCFSLDLLARLLLCSKSVLFCVSIVVLHPLQLFLGVANVFIWIIEVLRSEFEDVEVVDFPLFDVQFNDSVGLLSPSLLRVSADVLLAKMWTGDVADVSGFVVIVNVVSLY